MVAYKTASAVNKCCHSEFGMPVVEVCIFTNNYLACLFSFILPIFLKFINVHSKILLGFIGYGIISRDFLRFPLYRKHSLCFLEVCWNSASRLGSLLVN